MWQNVERKTTGLSASWLDGNSKQPWVKEEWMLGSQNQRWRGSEGLVFQRGDHRNAQGCQRRGLTLAAVG